VGFDESLEVVIPAAAARDENPVPDEVVRLSFLTPFVVDGCGVSVAPPFCIAFD
jgi:hypothetical protein